jgi:uncharacterized protein
MRKNLLCSMSVAALAMLFVLPVTAHHSTAMFDFAKTVDMQGTIKSFQWTNPHTWTVVTVEGDATVAGDYGLEGMSPNYLSRNGWTKRTLNVGDKVTLKVHPLKDGRKGGFMVSVKLPDGTVHYNLPQRPGATAADAAAAAAALNAHRPAVREVAQRYRTANPRVFGSVVKGLDRDGSDLDLLVDALPGATLFDLGGLQVTLEALLGVPVDVVTPKDLPLHFRDAVIRESQSV